MPIADFEDKTSAIQKRLAHLKSEANGVPLYIVLALGAIALILVLVGGDALLFHYALAMASPPVAVADSSVASTGHETVPFIYVWILIFAGFGGAHVLIGLSPTFATVLQKVLLPISLIFLIGVGGIAAATVAPAVWESLKASSDSGDIVINLGSLSAASEAAGAEARDWVMDTLSAFGALGVAGVMFSVPFLSFVLVSGLLDSAKSSLAKIQKGLPAHLAFQQINSEFRKLSSKANALIEANLAHDDLIPTAQGTGGLVAKNLSSPLSRVRSIISDIETAGAPENISMFPVSGALQGLNLEVLKSRAAAFDALDVPALAFAVKMGRYPKSDECTEKES
jgi:hypothetical protein